MRKFLIRQKWFILASIVFLFFAATSTKVALAGTDSQLQQILKAGLNGLSIYFSWLINVLQEIW